MDDNLKIEVAVMQTDLKNLIRKVDDHSADQKKSDAKVENRFEQSQSQMNIHFDKLEQLLDRKDANFKEQFADKKEFSVVKSIVYGMVALILTAFITGLIISIWKT